MTARFASLDELRARTSAKWRAYPPDVLPAFVAELDLHLAEPVAAALHQAVDHSDTGYRWLAGLPEALAGFAADTWGWAIDPGRVSVVPDVVTALGHAIEVLTQPGDGVVINGPVYHPFWTTIESITGRTVVDVPMARLPDGGWALDVPAIAAAFARPDVSAFVLCSPHNPTGTVPTPAELQAIADAAMRHGVAVIADEIHGPLAHPGVPHTPFLSVAPAELPAVSLLSASKGWNLAGLKCAQIVSGSERLARTFRTAVPIEASFATGHFGVIASIAAYQDGRAWLDEVRVLLADNARQLQAALAQRLPEVVFALPSASYLAWLDCTGLGLGDNPAAAFLAEGRVALNEGLTFGPEGAGFARLNFGTSPILIDLIVDRMAAALAVRDDG